MNNSPIGIFDSGLGGISILQGIREELPQEDILYYGDCLNAPYGDRSPEFIIERSIAITQFLLNKGAKAIVVACNTATAEAVNTLREKFVIPIIGVEPAVKPAAAATKTKTVGVIATTRTLTSQRYLKLVRDYAGENVKVVSVPCPGLMECVERGDWNSFATQSLIEKYLQPIRRAGADQLVLGCTHYPFLMKALRQELGKDFSIIDPSPAVARELHHRLREKALLAEKSSGTETFFISGNIEGPKTVISRLWPKSDVCTFVQAE